MKLGNELKYNVHYQLTAEVYQVKIPRKRITLDLSLEYDQRAERLAQHYLTQRFIEMIVKQHFNEPSLNVFINSIRYPKVYKPSRLERIYSYLPKFLKK